LIKIEDALCLFIFYMSDDTLKNQRWKQRFSNLKKAFHTLEEGVNTKNPNKLEKQGVIKSFEFTFELTWKTLKDFLESKNVEAKFPRDVIKQSYTYELITDGELWIEMLDSRNILAHTYDEEKAEEVYQKIKKDYFGAVSDVFKILNTKLKLS